MRTIYKALISFSMICSCCLGVNVELFAAENNKDKIPAITFKKIFWNGDITCVKELNGGGYILCGEKDENIWVFEINRFGNMVWQKTFGGAGFDRGIIIEQVSDNGFIIGGETSSYGSGDIDLYLLKISRTGVYEWDQTYGSSSDDTFEFCEQTSDNGFIIIGEDQIIKVNVAGWIEWAKRYGGNCIHQTNDLGYIMCSSDSTVKLDENGSEVWTIPLDGYWIEQTSDGGYIHLSDWMSFVVTKLDENGNTLWDRYFSSYWFFASKGGISQIDDGFIVGLDYQWNGMYDIFCSALIKLYENGNSVWWRDRYMHTYFPYDNYGTSFLSTQTRDGGFIFTGGGSTNNNHLAFVIKTDSQGFVNLIP